MGQSQLHRNRGQRRVVGAFLYQQVGQLEHHLLLPQTQDAALREMGHFSVKRFFQRESFAQHHADFGRQHKLPMKGFLYINFYRTMHFDILKIITFQMTEFEF